MPQERFPFQAERDVCILRVLFPYVLWRCNPYIDTFVRFCLGMPSVIEYRTYTLALEPFHKLLDAFMRRQLLNRIVGTMHFLLCHQRVNMRVARTANHRDLIDV